MTEQDTKDIKVYQLHPMEVSSITIPSNVIVVSFKNSEDMIQAIHNMDMTDDYDIFSYECNGKGYVPIAIDCFYVYEGYVN